MGAITVKEGDIMVMKIAHYNDGKENGNLIRAFYLMMLINILTLI